MHPVPNRMGLGMRPSFGGQGPPLSALAQQHHGPPNPHAQKLTTLFVGSISAGITDTFLRSLLSACGNLREFKRLLTPIGKPQGFGFAEFEEPEALPRAIAVLNGIELPSLEEGAPTKKLLVRVDEKTRAFLDAFEAQRIKTDADEAKMQNARTQVQSLIQSLTNPSANGPNAQGPGETYIIPAHLHDLQEADLPENQRGLVISEIAMFRERAAKRDRDKVKEERAPLGPKERSWGKPQGGGYPPQQPQQERGWQSRGGTPGSQPGPQQQQGWGSGPQGFNKPVGFVKGSEAGQQEERRSTPGEVEKTDEERERDGKQKRARDEENSFRDRERRYEPRERHRIAALERAMARERAIEEAEKRDRVEMRERLEVWDDDESDELFYTDRARWRANRTRHLLSEQNADAASRALEAREAEHLRQESEAFLARQMDEMRSLAEEQRKAGLLLDDGAPVKLNVSLASAAAPKTDGKKENLPVFGQEEEEEEGAKKRKGPLIKLDFSTEEVVGEKAKERLEKMKETTPKDKESLWKVKVRWEAISDRLIDTKLESIIRRKMTEYLGELDDDDLVMFVVEHLKDHKGPAKLVEGLEPVLVEEAEEFVIALWRQITFESVAYSEGLDVGDMLVD